MCQQEDKKVNGEETKERERDTYSCYYLSPRGPFMFCGACVIQGLLLVSLCLSLLCVSCGSLQGVCFVSSNPFLISSSSLSFRAADTDIPDPLSPSVSIVHCSREVFQALSCIGTELLYIGSSWSSCLWSSMWWGPLVYVVYEFVLTSLAVSCMSGSSNLDRVSWWVVDDCITAVLWGVATRIYSIFLAAFLCNCYQAFSPYVPLASRQCIHTAVSTRPRFEKTAFHFIGQVWHPCH